ncbi:MAG: BlaI/MecI/CopY family transcriptional regulator [Oscillospiraceae bacterium]|nr:BlaI/MecI/CopY family transcriptional regulator [Oscillospiraceae bacterium]
MGGNIDLTHTEWNMMECLWERSPRNGREAVEYMAKSVGWSRSTTLTMLRRMTEKGYIRCDEGSGIKEYYPLVDRELAVRSETEGFLERVYKGSVSTMLSALTDRHALSKTEIDELYAILKSAEEASGND